MKCMWCDRDSEFLCDSAIAFKAVGVSRDKYFKVTGLLTGADSDGEIKHWTCDAPMCTEHAKLVGFVCGAETDGIHICPFHAEHGEDQMKDMIIFENEEPAKRRELYSRIRRSIIKINAERLG